MKQGTGVLSVAVLLCVCVCLSVLALNKLDITLGFPFLLESFFTDVTMLIMLYKNINYIPRMS